MFIRVPEGERTLYLDNAIQLLYHAFPNTWDQRGPHQGHGWRSWETSSAIVAHLSSLMSLQNEYDLKATNTEVFAELVFRIGTYVNAISQLDTLNPTLTLLDIFGRTSSQPRQSHSSSMVWSWKLIPIAGYAHKRTGYWVILALMWPNHGPLSPRIKKR